MLKDNVQLPQLNDAASSRVHQNANSQSVELEFRLGLKNDQDSGSFQYVISMK